MAGNSLSLVWDLVARDGASPTFDRVAASADRAAVSTERATASTERAATSLSGLAKVGAIAAVAFVGAAVKMASDFQQQMTLVQTQAGASANEVRKMTPAILALAGQTAQAPEALATSLYHVESTGLRGAQALQAVKIAAEGATVAHADLEQTTNALTAVLASGIVPATESFSQAMGQLNTIVGSGDMKLSDLNDALGTGFLVQIKQYGATLNDAGAALADFGDNNIRGADAATLLRMSVQAIAKPGVGAAAALDRIGLTVQQLQSDQQTGGLNKALTDLHSHLVNSGIAATEWGGLLVDAFTKKAGGGIVTLIGTFDRFEQKYKEVSAGGASFGDAWAATTKTAAFQVKALEENVKAMTISVGGGLTPAVTGLLTWVNQTGVPALQHLGGGLMNVAHWFGDLPAPIRDVGLALGGLALANAIGLTGTLAGGISRVATAFSGAGGAIAGFGDEMALQSRLAQMDAAGVSELDAALGGLSGSAARAAGSLTAAQVSMTSGAFAGWDLALSQVVVEEDAVAAGAGRMSSMMGAAATRGAAAASSLFSALGGGAGLAIGATLIALPALSDAFDLLTGHEIDTTSATQAFTDALEQTNGAINSNIDRIAQQQLTQAGIVDVLKQAGISAHDAISAIEGNADAQHRVNSELQTYIDKQNFLGQQGGAQTAAHLKVTQDALTQLEAAFGSSAEAAAYFSSTSQDAASGASGAGQASADATPQLESLGNAAGMTADEIKAANKEWEKWIHTAAGLAAAFTDPLQTYQTMLQQKQQAEQASAQATADSTKSSKDSWKDYVQNVGVSLSEYAQKLEDELKNQQQWKDNLVIIAQRGGFEVAQQFENMGIQGADLTAQMANATNENFTRMATDMITQAAAGGDGAAQVLNDKLKFMAEVGREGAGATVKAMSDALGIGLNQVAALAAQYGIVLATGFEPILKGLGKPPIVVPGATVTRPGVIGMNADGGFITGPGTGRSDSILSFLSNGEFVVNAVAAAQNRPLLEAINSAPRYAGGGFTGPDSVPHPYSTAPYGWIAQPGDGTMAVEYGAAIDWFTANALAGPAAPGAPAAAKGNVALGQALAAARGWGSGAEWNALYALWQRESGWRNTAQNPTSTAYGIPQFLNGTWASTGYAKTSDPRTQILAGMSYIASRFHDPIGAWAHETQFGWYDGGGWLPPGLSLAMNGTGKPERVSTAAQDAALGGGATFHLYDSNDVLIGTMRGHADAVAASALKSVFNRGEFNG